MLLSKKAVALAAGVVASLSLATLAQDPAARGAKGQTIVVGGSIDWIEKSDVSALKEGVLEQIEFHVGQKIKKGQEIGSLHDKMAELTETKAALAARSTGEIAKAEAQKKLAISTVARLTRLKEKNIGFVSRDEEEKAAAELGVAEALLLSANDNQKLAKADHDLAVQARKEHRIIAPFSGIITDRLKNPGEAVRANEAVIRLGGTEKLRFVGWVPLETALRLKGNEVVDVRPMIEGADLPIEQKRFRGKLTAVSREVNPLTTTGRGTSTGTPEVMVLAEVENPEDPEHPEFELRQGMKGEMTVFIGVPAPKVASIKPR
ncbi:MAG: family efflux transporter, subunit [Planctomycetota bacterium]|nr:family efflux transporter, subunit [Planctomycetota bacterium]